MRKVIFFDVDGTLVTEDDRAFLPESTRQAIAQARSNGHLTFINTGRTRFNLGEEITGLGFDGYICGCGTYIEYNGDILLHNKLDQSLCRGIAALMRKCKAAPVYERSDCLFFDSEQDDNPGIKYFKEVFISQGIRTDRTTEDDDFSFDKFVFWSDEKTDLNGIFSVIEKDFMVIDRGNGFYENVPKGFTKATAIDDILNKLDISRENAYAVGDSMNDLPMLEAVPNSIAMGGAEKLYPYVSFVTKSVEDNGIEYAMKHFGII